MATVTGVRVVSPSGTERIYQQGRTYSTDGYGDYVIYDEDGEPVATRRRKSVEDIERVFEEDGGS